MAHEKEATQKGLKPQGFKHIKKLTRFKHLDGPELGYTICDVRCTRTCTSSCTVCSWRTGIC